MQRCRQEGDKLRRLFSFLTGQDGMGSLMQKIPKSFVQNCGQWPGSVEVLEWRCLSVDGGTPFPRALLPAYRVLG